MKMTDVGDITLNENDLSFIRVVKAFDFLRKEGYSGKEFHVYGRECPYISFHKRNRNIIVYSSEVLSGFEIIIEREKPFAFSSASTTFAIHEYYGFFNRLDLKHNPPIGEFNLLKGLADFIQQHLMPVVRGEVWIDELIKRKDS